LKDISNDKTAQFPVLFSFLKSGAVRITADERVRQRQEITLRHDSTARKERYNEAGNWALLSGPGLDVSNETVHTTTDGVTTVQFGPSKSYEAVITHKPFGVEFKRDGETQIKLNDRGLLNIEHWRAKVEKTAPAEGEEAPKAEPEVDESTWWEESFGGNTDTKPRGPEAVALDITFPGYEHVYGIPSHASSLALKETRQSSGHYSDPYRLYNSDVFEYITDSPMTLYGAIPFMQAHKKGSTVGVFWLNAAETWIDLVKPKTSVLSSKVKETQTHWISEAGQLDLFVFLGPKPSDVLRTYTELTGTTTLPQLFSLGHHQCRWNYISQDDVKSVDDKMDEFNIPYDVIWLDIEYTDGKKYFTWDPHTFSDPLEMQKHLDDKHRKLVTIIDPHIKNEAGYKILDDLKAQDFAVHNKEGKLYDGWCWPGSSVWIDCFNPEARAWWKTLFEYENFPGSSPNQFIWNDMNEPSVFNGPETTMPKDNLHFQNWEHRDLHNINGMTFHHATYYGLVERKKGVLQRPFVLTRAFFAGSQRTSAMWTGDNQATWEHLAQAFPMLLSQGIAGFPFAGADVGGFFGNPSKELLTRWYQAGAFYPFFRAHAHIDTRRREPYLAGEPYTGIMTQALRLRYALLPSWYTAFFEASLDGSPVLRPHYYVCPDDEAGFDLDDQFFLGSTGLLAKPVMTEGATSVDIYLPNDDQPYYNYFGFALQKRSKSGYATIPAPLDTIPLLIRGGGIITRRDRPRRNSALMAYDPYTLVIAVDKDGLAQGQLYVDDGETFEYNAGAYLWHNMTYSSPTGSIDSQLNFPADATPSDERKAYFKSMEKVRVEKIIIVGAGKEWKGEKHAGVKQGSKSWNVNALVTEADVDENGNTIPRVVTIRDPKIVVTEGWQVLFGKLLPQTDLKDEL
jgi:alpha 1,3-glucosidase